MEELVYSALVAGGLAFVVVWRKHDKKEDLCKCDRCDKIGAKCEGHDEHWFI